MFTKNNMFAGLAFLLAFMAIPCLADDSDENELQVGTVVNQNEYCLNIYNTKDTVKCSDLFNPICANWNEAYISGQNSCTFCANYGNTNSIVVDIGGDEDSNCGPIWSILKKRRNRSTTPKS